MLVQVLKRFEGPRGRMYEPSEVLDLSGRNIAGLIEYGFLAPVQEAKKPPEAPPASSPPSKGRKAKAQ